MPALWAMALILNVLKLIACQAPPAVMELKRCPSTDNKYKSNALMEW
jgi:hypothetical protein